MDTRLSVVKPEKFQANQDELVTLLNLLFWRSIRGTFVKVGDSIGAIFEK